MEVTNKNAVLLINLGSPQQLNKKSVKNYLRIFLSDDFVLDIPKIFQQALLRLFILPFRPKTTLHAYEQIWTEEGSPLIISTEKLGKKLSSKTGWKVSIAMRYEEPSIEGALMELKNEGYNNIYVVPLYPHNAMATVITTQVEVLKIASEVHKDALIEFVEPFYDDPMYIEAMATSIKPYIDDEKIEKLFQSLKDINTKLWVIEDDKRQCEKEKDFSEKFIKLSRDVHFLNDNRAKIKLEINNLTGSKIKEIKEYTSY